METQQRPEAPVPVWEQLGLSQEAFDKLPPSARTHLQRTHCPQPPEQRRPQQGYRPTPEEQTELDAITNRDDRVTRYRQLRDQAAASQ
jgi:hypothetical protein